MSKARFLIKQAREELVRAVIRGDRVLITSRGHRFDGQIGDSCCVFTPNELVLLTNPNIEVL